MNAELVKDGIQWAWQLIRRDVFAMMFVASGETVKNALQTAKALEAALLDAEEEETTAPDPPKE